MGKKKNKPFAIKGESARSAEIIEVFEMLGVTNTSPLTQRILDDYLYFVKDGCIWVTPEHTESQKEYYIFKFIATVFVTIMNYIASKLIIFRNANKGKAEENDDSCENK